MRRPRTEAVEAVAAAGAVSAAVVVLIARLAGDVGDKPIFVDEVVAGLTAARPFLELVQVVVVDRGGAPAHFVLAHVVFLIHASADALRWLSVACAAATVAVTFDLARRLDGKLAGVVAAAVVATSPLLGVYGSFGRMYALFALAGALAADLLVRALDERTPSAAAAAAAAVALLPFVHPYGVVPAVVIAAAAAVRLRRSAVPLAVLGALTAVPIVVAGLRLADRFGVGNRRAPLLSPGEAVDYGARVVGDLSGGDGLDVGVAVLLVVAGGAAMWARRRPFVLGAAAVAVLPLVLLVLVPTGRPQGLAHLSSRHMIFVLPLWAALAGCGAAALAHRAPRALAAPAAATLGALLVLGMSNGSGDPRTASGLNRVTGSRVALASPAAWLRGETQPGDLLFYGSPVYLAALPATRHARLLDPTPGGVMGRTLARIRFPVAGTVVAVPYGRRRLDLGGLVDLPPGSDVHASSGWIVVRVDGPFATARAALEAMSAAFETAAGAVPEPSRRLRAFLRASSASLCAAVRGAGGRCSTRSP